jgi:hypothetical protein
MKKATRSGLWNALMQGFTPEERADLERTVDEELRKQLDELSSSEADHPAEGERPRRPGRPPKRRKR